MAEETKRENPAAPEIVRRQWFHFFPMVWMGDRFVRSLTLSAQGLYLGLMCRCWIDGEIPGNPDSASVPPGLRQYLASVWPGWGHVAARCLARSWPGLRQHFVKTTPGFMCNKRILKQLERADPNLLRAHAQSGVEWSGVEKITPPSPPKGGDNVSQKNGNEDDGGPAYQIALQALLKKGRRRNYVDRD